MDDWSPRYTTSDATYDWDAVRRLWDRIEMKPAKPGDLEVLLEMNSPESRPLIMEGLARYDDLEDC